jgi:hypothetical protein
MPAHKQVWAKVNAPVDAGIAGIVAGLSEFPENKKDQAAN